MILKALAKRHYDDFFMTEVKNGPTFTATNLLKLDAVAIKKSWVQPMITGYEVKVDRGDFLRDEKWPGYLNYCHRFAFVCPSGMIQPGELSSDIGLIWYNPEKNSLHTKRKPVHRQIEIPWELLYYILICRIKNERHPFFSDTREQLQAWVEDKEDRKRLGMLVSHKIADLEWELKKAKNDIKYLKEAEAELEQVRQILIEAGIIRGYYGWLDQLKKYLESNNAIPQGLAECVAALGRDYERLKRMVGEA